MYTLIICPTGTVDAFPPRRYATKRDAIDALEWFARGYAIHGLYAGRGTLTTRSGRVNQASYVWRIDAAEDMTSTIAAAAAFNAGKGN